MAKKTTITIQTNSVMVIRAGGSIPGWCSACGMEAEMIPVRQFGVVSNLDHRTVEQWLDAGQLHRSEAAEGSPLICLNSLLAHLTGVNPAWRGTAQAHKETK